MKVCGGVWGCVGGVFKIFMDPSKIWPDLPQPDHPLSRTTPSAGPPKIPREDPKEREERKKIVAGEGKKREILAPHPCGSTLLASTILGPP